MTRARPERSDEHRVLDEGLYLRRRELLKALGLGGLAAAALPVSSALGCDARAVQAEEPTEFAPAWEPAGGRALYPAKRVAPAEGGFAAQGGERAPTPEAKASTWNNFYEFLPGKAGPVWRHTDAFRARPWSLTIAGLVEEQRTVDLDEVARVAPLEERVYRFRCVEAWSMVVPWTGIPLARFVAWCRPKPEARFVRFVSFLAPEQAPGQKKASWYPWPYYEALRLDEATNPLALLVTGIYGHGLPAQHGAPLRVIVPWKYGYKSPKSIVRVEFTASQPKTFWNDLSPSEYGFLSNVDPAVPHPRWSQATERDLATGKRIPTLPYNGYAAQVASLYR